MFATSKDPKSAPDSGRQPTLDCHCWTILLLTPPGFIKKLRQDSGDLDPVWKEVGKHRHKPIAELTCIVHALRGVVDRWTILYQYIRKLLDQGFMNSRDYVKLLFDDETFSQSRLYFWVIGCLNEFDISMEDNIKQWTLFRKARVTPYCKKDLEEKSQKGYSSSASDAEKTKCQEQFGALDQEADELRETLQNLRLQFQNQRIKMLALRDGVSCVLTISSLCSPYPSSVTKQGPSLTILLLLSYSMLVLSWRAERRRDWDKMSSC